MRAVYPKMGSGFCLVRSKGLSGLALFPIGIHCFRAIGKRMAAGNASKRRPPNVVIDFDYALGIHVSSID
jgi:hypothetical protein